MRLGFSNLAVTASLLASATNLVALDIPVDLPVSTLLTSAQSHLARGETREALAYYDAAVAKDPSNYMTLFKRATTYLSLGRRGRASEDFGRVLDLKPGFEGAHIQLAKIKIRSADWEGARSAYIAARKNDDSPELVELAEAQGAEALAEAAEKENNWEECISQASASISVAPGAAHLRERRSRCRFQRGEVEEGMGDLHHVLQLRPGNTDPHILISAITFYVLADFDRAIAQLKKCLHSDPDSKVCHALLKQEKHLQKAFSKVESQLNRGQTTMARRSLVGSADEPGLLPTILQQMDNLRQDGSIPEQAEAKLYATVVEMTCQAMTESKHKDAPEHCEKAIQLNPQSFWGLIYKGESLVKSEEYDAAIQAFEKAAEIRPDKGDKVHPLLRKAQIARKRSQTKDYYKVLGVANDADERQIKAAYRKLTKKYHPDKAAKQGIDKDEASKKMASIHEAYEVLSNPELRARFDQGDDPNSQERGSPFQGSPFGGGHPFMFHQDGGGANFKFHFAGGGGPFGF
ncbi:DnaJ and TPR domain protein [Metarhizium album ARSEF 1941]|uniref:Tetratricopeptide repeat and J domain-containing co-chaperone DNJ1 n=1 Tax=Metarhizium album (strain ARSEF 1941) TaxID=1081103 RepID=A0A0B2X428_METAS|nr:DnaJ and TPR domain protein [Metarhizium album ARSEF 1941]KHO01109.1 DnaJ and TPR domain protein [Metarhizium album ARSEF 1941]